jgi:hypothetical protein
MSILIEFMNLIILKSTLGLKYEGGLDRFIKDISNQSLWKIARSIWLFV